MTSSAHWVISDNVAAVKSDFNSLPLLKILPYFLNLLTEVILIGSG